MKPKSLREYRKSMKQNLADFAKQFGINPATLSRWETGENKIPAERVSEVCAATGLRKHQLRPDLWRAA